MLIQNFQIFPNIILKSFLGRDFLFQFLVIERELTRCLSKFVEILAHLLRIKDMPSLYSENIIGSGQIIIFHQPGFP